MSDTQNQDPGHDAGPADDEAPPSSMPPTSMREAATVALVVTAATAAVITYAFNPARAGQAAMLLAMGALYAGFAGLCFYRLHRRGELRQRFRPLGGDLSLGAVTAGLLYGAARIVEHAVAPHGTPREAWVVRLYLQLGDPNAQGRRLVGVAVFAVAALEEIVWRGLVMRTLEDAVGPARALALSSLLFAVAHLPTLLLLRDPAAGLNPLIVLAALGCSVVWGGIVLRTQRMVPAIFSHALFSWAIVEFPIWRP
jgi:hypothetical protein